MKWFVRTLAGLGAAALSTAAIAEADFMEVTSKGGLNVGNESQPHWFALGGRMHYDWAGTSADAPVRRELYMGRGATLRRMETNFRGGLGCNWNYRITLNFEPAALAGFDNEDDRNLSRLVTRLGPTFLEYTGFSNVKVAIGQVSTPTGLQSWGGSNEYDFMEAAAPVDTFHNTLGNRLGLYASGHWNHTTAQFAALLDSADRSQVSGEAVNNIGANNVIRSLKHLNDHWGFAGRLTHTPWHNDTYTVHFGINGVYQDLANHARRDGLNGDVASSVILGARHLHAMPEVRGRSSSALVSTLRGARQGYFGIQNNQETNRYFRANSFYQMGLEAAVLYKAYHLQAEYIQRTYKRNAKYIEVAQGRLNDNGTASTGSVSANVKFQGAYVSGGWVFAGGERAYEPSTGTISNPQPEGCLGAWEVVARWSHLNLEDEKAGFNGTDRTDDNNVASIASHRGENGIVNNFGLGLNWFPNHHVAFKANYVLSKVKFASPRWMGNPRGEYGANSLQNSSRKQEVRVHYFGLRAQAAF